MEEIIANHGGVESTLESTEGKYAVSMCLMQIGENLGRIQSLSFIEALPVKDAKGLRNFLSHHYDGTDWDLIRLTLSKSIPELKSIIISLLTE